jgi:hypothetical protein
LPGAFAAHYGMRTFAALLSAELVSPVILAFADQLLTKWLGHLTRIFLWICIHTGAI